MLLTTAQYARPEGLGYTTTLGFSFGNVGRAVV
jgi:hypothetical protein